MGEHIFWIGPHKAWSQTMCLKLIFLSFLSLTRFNNNKSWDSIFNTVMPYRSYLNIYPVLPSAVVSVTSTSLHFSTSLGTWVLGIRGNVISNEKLSTLMDLLQWCSLYLFLFMHLQKTIPQRILFSLPSLNNYVGYIML